MNMCHIPNGFPVRAISMYNRKIVDKKEILRLRTVSNIGIYCSSDRELVQFIINVRKLHRQHQCTLQLAWRHGVLFVWVRLDDRLTGQNNLDFLQN